MSGTHRMDWLKPHAGKLAPAPKRPGYAKYKPTEPAPGRYVKKTSEYQV